MKRVFKIKKSIFFIIFKGLSVSKKCLRPESAPLKGKKQNVKINNTYSVLQVLLPGVPQGSILCPSLFSIFINDLLLGTENAELHNFADGNFIYRKI